MHPVYPTLRLHAKIGPRPVSTSAFWGLPSGTHLPIQVYALTLDSAGTYYVLVPMATTAWWCCLGVLLLFLFPFPNLQRCVTLNVCSSSSNYSAATWEIKRRVWSLLRLRANGSVFWLKPLGKTTKTPMLHATPYPYLGHLRSSCSSARRHDVVQSAGQFTIILVTLQT